MGACAAPGPSGDEVPPVFVDRAGGKVALQQQHSRNSRSSLGVVLEQARPPSYLFQTLY